MALTILDDRISSNRTTHPEQIAALADSEAAR